MKKIWFVCFLLFVLPVFAAENNDCDELPSCEELGYTMTVNDCTEKSFLRCPLEPTNDDAVFCTDNE